MNPKSPHESTDYRALLSELRGLLVRNPDAQHVENARLRAEDAAANAPRREDRARFCQVLAQHYSNYALQHRSDHWLAEAERLSQGVPELEASTAYVKAVVRYQVFDFPGALQILEKQLTVPDVDMHLGVAARLYTLYAGVLDQVGRIDAADDAFRKAIELREALGDENGKAVVYYNYGEFCAKRDDESRALEFMERAYNIEKSLGYHHAVAQSAMQMALLHAQRGSKDQAQMLYAEAQTAATACGVPAVIAFVKANAATLYERLHDQTKQLTALLDAKTYLDRHSFESMKAIVLGNLGELYVSKGDYSLADPLLERALTIAKRDGNAYAIGQMLYATGLLRRRQGRLEESSVLLREAVEQLSEIKSHVRTLKAFGELAAVQADLGATHEACMAMADWARTYIEEHNETVERRLRRLQETRDAERQESQEEIYRLRNVELSAAMDKLKELNVELQDLAVEKDEFMAIAAHDLRNPLADMRSMLQTVLNHYDVLSKSDVLDIARDLLASTTRMSATVHAFLEISRTDRRSNGLQEETLDLVHLAHRAVERYSSRAASKGIYLKIQGPSSLFAMGDASVVDAVIDNLISNSLKFAPSTSTVTLDVSREGENCVVRVIDEGPGVAAADQPRLFTKYGKLSTKPTGNEDSLGLGLYLAKRMAERMQSRLEYEDLGQGACFVFTLRCPKAEAQ